MSKARFDTVRDLEQKNSGLFHTAIIMGVVGLIMLLIGCVVPAIMILGGISILVGLGLFFYAMVYTVKLQKEPTVRIYCPYCAVKNDVFKSRKEFACDICGRRIGFGPSGEPVALDPVEEDD